MIYRCTARFVRSFDQLPQEARAAAVAAIRTRFTASPRLPSADAHVIRGALHDVNTMRIGDDIRVTYAYESDPAHANDFVCVLRDIGVAA